jgi:nucleotide-binding universal stress UspA family protein
MVRTILVPLDGSVFGEHALPHALGIARRAGAALELTHVHVTPAPLFLDPYPGMESTLDAGARKEAQEYLEALKRRLPPVAGVTVRTAYLEGGVAEALRQHAEDVRADLIVMTTHGRGPFSRFWLGSVADELLRQSPVPLLLVRPEKGAPDLAKDIVYRQILVALDGSPLAELALRPATALGRLMDSNFTLFRAVPPVRYAGDDLGSLRDEPGYALLEQWKAQAEGYLDGIAFRMRQDGLRPTNRVEVMQQPAEGIVSVADETHADLIALATHGRGGLARLVLDSVADKVVRGSTRPVLVSRPAPWEAAPPG